MFCLDQVVSEMNRTGIEITLEQHSNIVRMSSNRYNKTLANASDSTVFCGARNPALKGVLCVECGCCAVCAVLCVLCVCCVCVCAVCAVCVCVLYVCVCVCAVCACVWVLCECGLCLCSTELCNVLFECLLAWLHAWLLDS